jgi:hypothetical protein
VFRDLAHLCGKSPLATLAVNDRELVGRNYAAALERFTAAIAAGGQSRPSGETVEAAVA